MLFQAKAYLQYLLKAKDPDRIKDNLMSELLEKVCDEDKTYYAFLTLSSLRKKLKKDTRVITVTDLGAGSKNLKSNRRRISDIARLSVKKEKFATALFRLVESENAINIIEIGTSLGLTTSYIGLANKSAKVLTLEGCPEIAAIARENLRLLQVNNVRIIEGGFDETLPIILKEDTKFDLVFIDGNHTKDATLKYFEMFKNNISKDAILIFDDIHWSKGMSEAWDEIINDPFYTCTVDLFEMGLVFVSSSFQKGNHIVKY